LHSLSTNLGQLPAYR